MASRFKTVTIEEVTDRTGTKNSKGIFGEETQKITNFSKSACFKRNCIILNVLGFRYNKPVKTITVVSVICHPRH